MYGRFDGAFLYAEIVRRGPWMGVGLRGNMKPRVGVVLERRYK